MNLVKKLLVLGMLLTASNGYTQTNWSLVKETNLKGSISGTTTQGSVLKVSSNEFYVVNNRSRQRVRVRNPEVKIFQNGSDFKLIIEDFNEPLICKRLRDVIETNIDGEFKGWDGETIFKFMNGQIWQQSSYAYMYHYAYTPEVLIYEYGGKYLMKVEDVDEVIEVKLLNQNASKSTSDVIESRIDADFEGWEGETIFKLSNGQIWQQASYAYHYHYAYSPRVIIYKTLNGYEMKVDGIDDKILVKRLK